MSINIGSLVVLTLTVLSIQARGAFHVMQVEQIIGGVDGDSSRQAIQLRLRTGGQTVVSSASLWASDAAGGNRTLLLNIAGNVTSGNTGDRILFTTAAFNSAMIAGGFAGFTGDFLLTTAIPAAYLAAGKITFEADGGTVSTPGTIYWAVAWGGASYTGTNTGASGVNDSDGFFGDNLTHPAPFGSALPTAARKGLLFSGAANALSTNNASDYALSAGAATVTKNNGTSFTVVPEPGTLGTLALGLGGLGALLYGRRKG